MSPSGKHSGNIGLAGRPNDHVTTSNDHRETIKKMETTAHQCALMRGCLWSKGYACNQHPSPYHISSSMYYVYYHLLIFDLASSVVKPFRMVVHSQARRSNQATTWDKLEKIRSQTKFLNSKVGTAKHDMWPDQARALEMGLPKDAFLTTTKDAFLAGPSKQGKPVFREAESPNARMSAQFPPALWPHTGQGNKTQPVQYVYRIMQQSGHDLEDIDHEIRSMNAKDFRRDALWWIAHGSDKDVRSPLWHCSTTLKAANALKFGSSIPSTKQGIAIRIDVKRWFMEGQMPKECVIDVSTQKAQQAFFGPNVQCDPCGCDQETVSRGLGFSIERAEVLIKWRGTVPPEFCEVVDLSTGEDICQFQLVLDAIQADLKDQAECLGFSPAMILTDSVVEDLTRESQAEKATQKQAKAEREKAASIKAANEKRAAEQAAADAAHMRPRSCSTSCNSKNVRTSDLRKTERARSERPSSDLRHESRPEQLSAPKKPGRPPPPVPEECGSEPSKAPKKSERPAPPVPEECGSQPSKAPKKPGRPPHPVPDECSSQPSKGSPRDLPEHAWPRPSPFDAKECGSQPSNQSARDLIRPPQGAPMQLGPAPQTQSSKDVRNAEGCAEAESTAKLSDQVTSVRSKSVSDLGPHVSQQSSTRSKSLPDLMPGAAPQSSAPVPVAEKGADHSPAPSVRLRSVDECSVQTHSQWSNAETWQPRHWDAARAEMERQVHRRNEVSKQALTGDVYRILVEIRQA